MMIQRRLILPLLSALALGACGGLVNLGPEGPPAAIYSLETLPRASEQAADVPRLLVESPVISSALETRRIAVRRADRTLAYLAGARWDDTASVLIQRHLAHSLDNLADLEAIGARDTDLPVDIRLRLDVRHFNVVIGDAGADPQVEIAWLARLVGGTSPELLASRYFETARASRSDAPEALARAFNAAINALTAETAGWIVQSTADSASAPSAKP